jgi:hypothetical protein
MYDFVIRLCRQKATVMKISIFVTLTRRGSTLKVQKAETWRRSGIRSINCLDWGYVLGQYMNIKHNLLYKTWAAGLRRWRLLKKRQNAKETCKIKHTYIHTYIANTDKDWPVTIQTHPPTREDAPWQTRSQLSWLQPKSGHESRRGSVPRLTDWQSQSDSESDWHQTSALSQSR